MVDSIWGLFKTQPAAQAISSGRSGMTTDLWPTDRPSKLIKGPIAQHDFRAVGNLSVPADRCIHSKLLRLEVRRNQFMVVLVCITQSVKDVYRTVSQPVCWDEKWRRRSAV